MHRVLPVATLIASAAALCAQAPATYSEFGFGCNGAPVVTAFALNDAAPALTVSSLPNEYAYPVFNNAGVAVQVLGFEVYTRTNTLNVEVGNAGIFRDLSGAGALAHTQPDVAGAGVGTIQVTGTEGWCSVAVSPPVLVQPGEAFYVQLDAYNLIAPPQHTTTGGVNAPAQVYYRRPNLSSYAWTPSVSVNRPMVRVTAVPATPGAASLIHSTLPVSGQTLTVDIENGPAFFPALGILGFSDTVWLGLPLPIDLGIVGAPNCTNFTSADQFFFLALDGSGSGSWSLSIPADPFFLGVTFFQQGAILGALNPLGAYVTNAGRATIGS
ncbi:MAG: hypothetical protein AB7O97_06205 [Planctomycetota bacterium]